MFYESNFMTPAMLEQSDLGGSSNFSPAASSMACN